MQRLAVLAVFVVLVSSAAFARADTVSIRHSGYLLDAADAPLTATEAPFEFRIHAAPLPQTVETAAWTGTCSVDVRGGYYAATLGDGTCGAAIDLSVLPAGTTRWLEVRVGGTRLLPRIGLDAQPNAKRAELLGDTGESGFWKKADDLAAATVGASTLGSTLATLLTLSGPQTIDGAKTFTATTTFGTGPAQATITDGAVTAGSFAGDGSGLTGLDAAQLTAGTVPDARIATNVPRLDGSGRIAGSAVPTTVAWAENAAVIRKLSATQLALGPSSLSIGGVLRTNAADTTITFTSANGLGGLDAATIAPHALYFVYAVPQGATYGLVASLLAPSVGPTGFATRRLVGAFFTNASAQFGSWVSARGTPATDWVAFTPTIASSASSAVVTVGNGVNAGRWRRVGDTVELQYAFQRGATGFVDLPSGAYVWGRPAGFALDLAKMATDGAGHGTTTGYGQVTAPANGGGVAQVIVYTGYAGASPMSGFWLSTDDNAIAAPLLMGSGSPLVSTSYYLSFRASYPVQGWSARALEEQ